MKLQKKIALITVTGFLVTVLVYSQTYIQEKNKRELREIAEELAHTWGYKLNLTEEQTGLLQKNIIAFTIKKNEIINSKINEDAKIRRLRAIQKSEHKALKKFLDEHQFENYFNTSRAMTKKS